MDDIKINDIIEVVVTGIQKYGVFVLVNDEYDGCVKILILKKLLSKLACLYDLKSFDSANPPFLLNTNPLFVALYFKFAPQVGHL